METEEKKDEVLRTEKRTFKYANDVVFEFDVDVSDSETAVAEITDFLRLMALAAKDLEGVRKEFADKIKKDGEPAAKEGTGEAPPKGGGSTNG